MSDKDWGSIIGSLAKDRMVVKEGGGAKAVAAQHAKGRQTARERIDMLVDDPDDFFELGLFAAYGMYKDWGGAPSAGVVTGIGRVSGHQVLIVANDATVKAGAFSPATVKKVLRAQRIAMDNRLPTIYLVDSSGVFLPLQDEVFPDEDDFGRVFRNNSVMSAMGIPQFAAIMGNCIAGGAYLPVLCDSLLMTKGSGLYLAGPALVKAAIGQVVSHEELGSAKMHAEVSGTIDREAFTEESCIDELRRMVERLPPVKFVRQRWDPVEPRFAPDAIRQVVPIGGGEYDVRRVLESIIDDDVFDEFRPRYGRTIVAGYARIGGFYVGIVASQRINYKPDDGPMQFGGVLYNDSAEKAARFVMQCNQSRIPLVFLQDVNGFMVGRESERGGIIKAGAKLVNAVSNSVVPKITVILGGSFGAGNYALCGKAFDPRFIFAWPTAKYAVMGSAQAASTIFDIHRRALEKSGQPVDDDDLLALRDRVCESYDKQVDVRYAAARGWVDAVIYPSETREALVMALEVVSCHDDGREFRTGVFQV